MEVFVTSIGSTVTRKSHTGYFTVLNLDLAGHLKEIDRGLIVDESNQNDMKTLLKAQRRWEFEEEDKTLLHLQPLPLTIERAQVMKGASVPMMTFFTRKNTHD